MCVAMLLQEVLLVAISISPYARSGSCFTYFRIWYPHTHSLVENDLPSHSCLVVQESLTALALVAVTLRLKVRIMRSKSVLPIFSEIQ